MTATNKLHTIRWKFSINKNCENATNYDHHLIKSSSVITLYK